MRVFCCEREKMPLTPAPFPEYRAREYCACSGKAGSSTVAFMLRAELEFHCDSRDKKGLMTSERDAVTLDRSTDRYLSGIIG